MLVWLSGELRQGLFSACAMKIARVFITDNGVTIPKSLLNKTCLISFEGKLPHAGENPVVRVTQVQATLAFFILFFTPFHSGKKNLSL